MGAIRQPGRIAQELTGAWKLQQAARAEFGLIEFSFGIPESAMI